VKRRRSVLGLSATIALSIAAIGITAAPAFADDYPTRVSFDDATPLTVAFGSEWLVPLTVTAPDAFRTFEFRA
jgi:hypothetical protein